MIERIAGIVKAARARAGLSLRDLASESGVPEETVATLERGQMGMTTTELFEVARVLSLDPIALLGGREMAHATPSVFLRHAEHQDFDDQDRAVLDEALDAGRALASLRAELGEPLAALQAGVFDSSAAAADRPEAPAQEGYRFAKNVRNWLGNPRRPLDDMAPLIERQFGIAVVVRALATTRSTAASVRAEDAAGIVINACDVFRKKNPLLGRNHLAHELCHILFDPSEGGLHIVVDLEGDRKTHQAEQRAKAFAAELLLPLPGLVALLGDPRGIGSPEAALDLVSRARSHFGTSHEIAANHLCNLSFVDKSLRDRLAADSSKFTGTLPPMSLPAEGEASVLIGEYVKRAWHEGYLTDGEARSLCGLDILDPLPWDEDTL